MGTIPHLLLVLLTSKTAHGPIKDYDAVLKSHGFLNPNDPVAISFWIISIVASTVFILFEIFAGEAGKIAGTGVSENVKSSFGTMRFIVSVGWSIYPLGYFFGYLMGGVADCTLNLVYNLADFVNKIAFCLAIWASAKKDTMERGGKEILLA